MIVRYRMVQKLLHFPQYLRIFIQLAISNLAVFTFFIAIFFIINWNLSFPAMTLNVSSFTLSHCTQHTQLSQQYLKTMAVCHCWHITIIFRIEILLIWGNMVFHKDTTGLKNGIPNKIAVFEYKNLFSWIFLYKWNKSHDHINQSNIQINKCKCNFFVWKIWYVRKKYI